MTRRIATLALALLAVSPSSRASGGPCAGSPLACFGSGSQTLVVAVDLPPRALGLLVTGSQTEFGSSFGSGRWCVADPRRRLGTVNADDDGTAVVRLEGRPTRYAGALVQVVWRDRMSGMTGATGIARLPG